MHYFYFSRRSEYFVHHLVGWTISAERKLKKTNIKYIVWGDDWQEYSHWLRWELLPVWRWQLGRGPSCPGEESTLQDFHLVQQQHNWCKTIVVPSFIITKSDYHIAQLVLVRKRNEGLEHGWPRLKHIDSFQLVRNTFSLQDHKRSTNSVFTVHPSLSYDAEFAKMFTCPCSGYIFFSFFHPVETEGRRCWLVMQAVDGNMRSGAVCCVEGNGGFCLTSCALRGSLLITVVLQRSLLGRM